MRCQFLLAAALAACLAGARARASPPPSCTVRATNGATWTEADFDATGSLVQLRSNSAIRTVVAKTSLEGFGDPSSVNVATAPGGRCLVKSVWEDHGAVFEEVVEPSADGAAIKWTAVATAPATGPRIPISAVTSLTIPDWDADVDNFWAPLDVPAAPLPGGSADLGPVPWAPQQVSSESLQEFEYGGHKFNGTTTSVNGVRTCCSARCCDYYCTSTATSSLAPPRLS